MLPNNTEERHSAFKYDVFISYCHRGPDKAVAERLQNALEHYRIPREIQKKTGRKRIGPVFRDQTELGVASDLFNEIESALLQSEYLLLVCSPRYVQSYWCQKEVETFLKHRDSDHILTVLIEGTPEESFPASLLEYGEPLAADLRADTEKQILKNVRLQSTRIAAPLLNCSYDELYQRFKVYRMRRIAAAAGIVAAVSLAVGAVTIHQNIQINRNYRNMQRNQSLYLADTVQELLEHGDRETALLVALEALPKSADASDRPYVAEARIALERALYSYQQDSFYNLNPLKILEQDTPLGDIIESCEEEHVLLTSDPDGNLYLWDTQNCQPIRSLPGQDYRSATFIGKNRLLVAAKQSLFCYQYRTGELLWQWQPDDCTSLLWEYDPTSDRVFCAVDETEADPEDFTTFYMNQLCWIDAEGTVTELDLHESIPRRTIDDRVYSRMIALSPDGSRVLWAAKETLHNGTSDDLFHFYLADTATGEILEHSTDIYTYTQFLDCITWIDNSHYALIKTVDGIPAAMGVGLDQHWELSVWETGAPEPLFRYEDISKGLYEHTDIQVLSGDHKKYGPVTLLSVVYDNVAVCLNAETGQRYSRVEDRSAIVSNHLTDVNSTQVIITQDGYVFRTKPTVDFVFQPQLTHDHYRLDLDPLYHCIWIDGKAFLFTKKHAYCYAGVSDSTGVPLESSVRSCKFTEDGTHMLLNFYNNEIAVCSTSDFSVCWKDQAFYDSIYGELTSALLPNGNVVYISPEQASLRCNSLDGKNPVSLDLQYEPGYGGRLALSPAGEHSALIRAANTIYYHEDSFLNTEDLESTVLWLADTQNLEISRQWTLEQLLDALPDELNLWGDSEIRIFSPRMCADESWFLIPVAVLQDAYDLPPGVSPKQALYMLRWSAEDSTLHLLPEELTANAAQEAAWVNYFENDGWMAEDGRIVLYDTVKCALCVIDPVQEQILQEIPLDALGCNEVTFTPDGQALVFQNALKQLCVYNLEQKEYSMAGGDKLDVSLTFDFYENGDLLVAQGMLAPFYSQTTSFYRQESPNVYTKETSVSYSVGSNGTVIVTNINGSCYGYQLKSYDEVIATAKKILAGRTLTDIERRTYLVD